VKTSLEEMSSKMPPSVSKELRLKIKKEETSLSSFRKQLKSHRRPQFPPCLACKVKAERLKVCTHFSLKTDVLAEKSFFLLLRRTAVDHLQWS